MAGTDLNPLNAPDEGQLLGVDAGPGSIPGTYLGKGPKKSGGKVAGKGVVRVQPPAKTRYMQLKTMLDQDRTSWIAHSRDLEHNFFPYSSRWLNDGGTPNSGRKKGQYIIDNTPLLAIRTLAAGLMSGVTNPSRPWFRVRPQDDNLYNQPGVPEWCEALTNQALRQLQSSNYYDTIQPCYREIATYGTLAHGCYELPADARDPDQPLVNFVRYTIGEYWISQNPRGRVDTWLRMFKWTARRVVERFVKDPYNPQDPGWRNISPMTRQLWASRRQEQYVTCYHVVEPNHAWAPGIIGVNGFPTRSVFFEEGGNPDQLLEVAGFHTMPVHVARWDLNSDDVYGHSPAMDSLGDAKSLQIQERRLAQAIDKQVDPPLIGDANLKQQRISMLPGDVNWLEGAVVNSFGLKPLYEVKPEIDGMLANMQDIKGRINSGCYTDVFQMLKSMGDQLKSGITATEISARQQERLLELGPLLNRLDQELYRPQVNQLLGIIFRRSHFGWQHHIANGRVPRNVEMLVPPPPAAIRNKPLKIEYISILAQAMRMTEIQGIQQLATWVLGAAATHPDILDKLNWDKGVDIIADRLAVPPEFVVPTAQANQVRAIRAKQQQDEQQQQQALAAAQVGSQALKNVAQSPLGANALQSLQTGNQIQPSGGG